MKHFYLHCLVFVCGAAVLALELLGTRILGPFYGVSLFLWSALITVTLAALSCGYILGGVWADKNPAIRRVCTLILVAGVWILLIPWIKRPFLSLAEGLGLRPALLLASFTLFFAPLTLLGTVAPFAIRIKAAALNEVGRTAGNLYAISTIASVISALATGFILIPGVGVTTLTLIIGGILVVLAVGGLFIEGSRKGPIVAGICAVILLGITAWKFPSERADPERGLLTVRQSPYAEIRVLDTENGRHLLIDGGIHTLVDTVTWKSDFHYAAVMDLPKYYTDKPGEMLLIGIGGGSLMKQYANDGWRVEAVEIDPVVVGVAREYFHLLPSDGTVYEMDGREFLSRSNRTYDVILMDAFGSSSIPFHLVTREVFGIIAAHLRAGGVFALNVETIGWNDPIVRTLAATMKGPFADVTAFPIEEPPNAFGNVVLLASREVLETKREPERNDILEPDWRYGPGYQKAHAWDNRFVPEISGVAPLTDDLNPIDLRSEAINLASREGLHQYFKMNGMSW